MKEVAIEDGVSTVEGVFAGEIVAAEKGHLPVFSLFSDADCEESCAISVGFDFWWRSTKTILSPLFGGK